MSIRQANFAPNIGSANVELKVMDLVSTTIMRVQNFEPPEGYYFADSGGKDSEATRLILILAKSKYDAHFNITGTDPPEVVRHIQEYHPETVFEKPLISMWRGIEAKGLPRRNARWCCEKLKEHTGHGRIVVTGIRWQESPRRSDRHMIEVSRWDRSKRFLHPLIDWKRTDVWDFLKMHQVPYCSLYDEGATGRYRGNGDFKRLGCVLCPMGTAKQAIKDINRWPKIAAAWERAARRFYDRHTEGTQKYATFEDFWKWWLSRRRLGKLDDCLQGRFI